MGVFKEIEKADGSGVTTFYRLSDVHDTVETDDSEGTATVIDYNAAQNKPSVNGVTLVGNKTSEDLGLQPAGDYITNDEADAKFIDEDELEAKNYVNETRLQEAIANIDHFHREIVNALPVTGQDNVLYMVCKQGSGEDIFNEYIWVGKTVSETGYEFIGTTATDLTDYYQKDEVDNLLSNKVDKVSGKGLSEQNYTLAEKTKLAGLENYDDGELRAAVAALHNYDDTEIRGDISDLEDDISTINVSLDNVIASDENKITDIRLVKSGDNWSWQNVNGDTLTFAQAQEALGHEDTILLIEDIENDGKYSSIFYRSYGTYLLIGYENENKDVIVVNAEDGNFTTTNLGKNTKYKGIVASLPVTANIGDIVVVQDSETPYIYIGSKWIPFDKGGAGVIPVATATTLGGVKVGEYLTVTEDGVLSFDEQELDYIYNDIHKKAAKTDLDAIYASLDNKVEYQSHVDTEADLPLIVDWDVVDEETPELVLDIQDNFNEIKINRNNVFSRGGKIKNILYSINKAWIPNDIGEDYRYWLGTSYSLSNGSNLWGLYVFNNSKKSSGGKQSTSVFLGKVTAPNNTEVALPFYYITATAKKHKKVRFYNFYRFEPECVNAWKIVHADGSIENVTFTSTSWVDKELTTNSLIFPDLANSGATALNYVDFMKFNLGSSSSTGYESEGYYAIGSPQSSLSFYQWDHSTLNNFRLAVEEVYPGIVGYNALHLEEFDDTYEGKLYHYTIAGTPAGTPLLIINTDNRMEYGFLNDGIKTGNLYSVGADNELFYIDPTYKYQHWAQGGGGGTSDYTALSNKPQINGTTLTGNKTGSDLGLVSSADVLTKTNTTSYTPSGDYQPATKKYVDDSVGGVFVPTKTSQLTNDSNFIGKNSNDLTYYYTKSQTDTLLDELGVKVGTSIDNNYRVNVLHSSNLWHYNTTKTTNGVTSTYENSTITLNGTAIGSGYNVSTNSAMLHLNAGNYALKLTEISGTKPSGQSLIIRNVTSGTNLVDTDFSTTDTYTFTLSSDADIAVMVYFWNNNVFDNYKFGVQLQKGSKTNAYKPYISPSIVVNGETIYTKGQNDVYTKTEIDTKIADYKLLGDFAVITGNYAYEESVTNKEITLSYPTGFTRDNCVVISIMLGNTTIKTKPLGCNSVMTNNSTATGAVANSVVLFESNIRLKLRNLYAKDYVESTTPQIMSQELPSLEYKIVLMKIPTQE